MKKYVGLLLILTLVFIAGCSSESSGSEADFPEGDIEFVAPATPGGGWDATARAMQKILGDAGIIEENINVSNKPGGGGEVGWQYLLGQDAHTISINSSLLVANNLLGQSELTYEDFTPLGILSTEWVSVAVPPDSPYETGAEVMEALKEDPTSLTIGVGPSLGNSDHLSFVQAAQEFGVDVSQVEFLVYESGGDVLTALLGGHVDVATMSVSESKEQHLAGEINMIAVSSEERIEGLEEVSTWQEQGVDMVFPHWRGVMGPPDMSEEEIAYWDEAIGEMVETEAWQEVMNNNEWEPFYHNSQESQEFLAEQTERFDELMTEAGLIE
ncbi:tripartite tricarboxylate transporter substrate binding protein [Virgibacillus sp. NKC19-16]|uniref:tripartite tricarboxylate transporter substrate binding protein n=1 Tax=Virgibacillus salidurans TaxID=2831673 RepID=UPI001F37AAA3|nr:tripartite tricarboxylate transporter substrate binding protein [Virgibacillus sp. NKC19-16]UJL47663.1 tripartite tricarboxylate transporter substrate binding protein [Virgibacillus sp. NKC19-16]